MCVLGCPLALITSNSLTSLVILFSSLWIIPLYSVLSSNALHRIQWDYFCFIPLYSVQSINALEHNGIKQK
jgi:hypothetical protein